MDHQLTNYNTKHHIFIKVVIDCTNVLEKEIENFLFCFYFMRN